MPARFLAVLLGGGFGSLARYAIGLAFASRYSGSFPLPTFLINVTGSFLIGLSLTIIPDRASPVLRPLIVTGILGGFTTFSAFEWETLVSPRSIAILYVASSVGLGLLACWAGSALGRLFTH